LRRSELDYRQAPLISGNPYAQFIYALSLNIENEMFNFEIEQIEHLNRFEGIDDN